MFKTAFTAAVATLALAPALANASELHQFSQDGVSYTYTAEQKGEVTIIAGRASTGQPFRLVVKGERVTGTFNDRAVAFHRAEAGRSETLAAN